MCPALIDIQNYDIADEFHHHHNPACTQIETLQAQMEQMATGPGNCGSSVCPGTPAAPSHTGTGRSSRSRRGSSRAHPGADAIDIMDTGKEKTVNFANCVSPPSPNDPGFMGINNEAYPCDCCQLDEASFRRSYSHQIPCGTPAAGGSSSAASAGVSAASASGMMHFSTAEVSESFFMPIQSSL